MARRLTCRKGWLSRRSLRRHPRSTSQRQLFAGTEPRTPEEAAEAPATRLVATCVQQAATSQQREVREQEERDRLVAQHARELNEQIADNAERRNNGKTDVRSEGREIAMSFAVERAKLERIRSEYVERLEKEGVNPQYLSEMKRCDLAKLQMR